MSDVRGPRRASRPVFPVVGRTVPAWVLAAVGVVAGLGGGWAAVGASPWWLGLAAALVVAGAVFPRGPFAALLVVQLAVATVVDGRGWGVLAVVLLTGHLVVATGVTWAVVPRRALVQLRALRPSALRFGCVQAGAQALAAVVELLGLGGHGGAGRSAAGHGAASALSALHGAGGWIGLVGALAILAVAVAVLVPALGAGRRSGD